MSTLLDMDVEEEHTENEDKDLSYEAYRAYIKAKKKSSKGKTGGDRCSNNNFVNLDDNF